MDDWLYLHEVRQRDLIREAEVARGRRANRFRPRRHTTYRPGDEQPMPG